MNRLTTKGQGLIIECVNCWKKFDCYEHCCGSIENVIQKLAEYEDAEEQGLLLRLPCKVGDTVYIINEDAEDIYLPSTRYYFIDECKFIVEMYNDIGKTVFITKEEAEQALAKMKEV